jgi:hypothetical protein
MFCGGSSYCDLGLSLYNIVTGNNVSVEYIASIFKVKVTCTMELTALGFRDSIVGIATSYGLDDRGDGARVQVGYRIFSSLDRPDRL